VLVDPGQIAERAVVAVRVHPHAIDEVGARGVQAVRLDALALVVEKIGSVVAEQVEDLVVHWSQCL
jgi:hypothetical protein